MYKCNNCSSEFEEPARKNICYEEYYGVDTLMGTRTNIDMFTCPSCGDEDIEELSKCAICEEWFNEDELHDTTEMINGGCGWCCSQCIEDGDMLEI